MISRVLPKWVWKLLRRSTYPKKIQLQTEFTTDELLGETPLNFKHPFRIGMVVGSILVFCFHYHTFFFLLLLSFLKFFYILYVYKWSVDPLPHPEETRGSNINLRTPLWIGVPGPPDTYKYAHVLFFSTCLIWKKKSIFHTEKL